MRLEELLNPDLYAQIKKAIDDHNAAETDKSKHVRFVDLSEGGYVSADKHTDKVISLSEQVRELTAQIGQRDADITALNEALTAAQADASKLPDAQTALAEMSKRYEADKQAWADKTAAQAYEFAIREKANELKFTSAAARRDFIREAIEKKFTQDGGTLLGYSDFVTQYKADNPGAVAEEEPPAPADPPKKPPQIVGKTNPGDPKKRPSLSEEMAAKNADPNHIVKFE